MVTRASWARLAACCAGAVIVADRPTAEACSIGRNREPLDAPADDAESMPTNPMLWLPFDNRIGREANATDELILLAPNGDEITLDVRRLRPLGIRVTTPSIELAPQTRYELWACTQALCSAHLRTFVTGDGPDLDAPPRPIEHGRDVEVERRVGPCAGTYRWVDLDLEFEGVLVVDLGLPQFDEVAILGHADIVTTDTEHPITIDEIISPLDEPFAARVGAFDQAGNFSGWQELAPIELGGCGCTSTDARARPAWLLLLPLARRRRRAP